MLTAFRLTHLASAILLVSSHQVFGQAAVTAPPPDAAAPISTRFFTMPTAEVVGSYQLRTASDMSLFEAPGRLSYAGLLAIGIGDIAQLEYRHAEAISVTGVNAPVPAAGVTIRLPLPQHRYIPRMALAFRLGLGRDEHLDGVHLQERVSELYAVATSTPLPRLTLALGSRIASAELGVNERTLTRLQLLPTLGWQLAVTPQASLIGEIGMAPRFVVEAASAEGHIDRAVVGRVGFRWWLTPSFALDGSMGYQAQTLAFNASTWRELVAWDLRLGTEVNLDWSRATCRALQLFCRR